MKIWELLVIGSIFSFGLLFGILWAVISIAQYFLGG